MAEFTVELGVTISVTAVVEANDEDNAEDKAGALTKEEIASAMEQYGWDVNGIDVESADEN